MVLETDQLSLASEHDRHVQQRLEPAPPDQQTVRRHTEAHESRHPLVLKEMARRLLLTGNAAGAQELLEKAIKLDPANSSLWLDLAATLRGLNRADEEMAALERVLALEPHNLSALLQKGSLEERQGKPRTAAATYRNALQTIPRGVEPPSALRPLVLHAIQAIEANNRALEAFLGERLKELRARHADQPLRRFEKCFATLVQRERIYRQQPTFMCFPNLPMLEFHERGDFPWLDSIEAASDDIRRELIDVLADGPAALEPYIADPQGVPINQWRELNHSRRWGVYFLWREGVAVAEHIARCPRTVAALKAWPRWDVPACGPTAVFSILDAKTRIPPHTGVSNTRLIVHLPLIVPPGCGFRVGAERREWLEGKAFVFDDTFEHEAWNDSNVPRAVLILDIWSPFLSMAERELVRSLSAGISEYYGTSPRHGS